MELEIRVDEAIRGLPDAYRAIFILSRYEKLSYKVIAEDLNISEKTVEMQMTKALKFLSTRLL